MIKFLLYLFESSICLAMLYLVYELFFKKETYFNFNRLYLQSSMFFALLIPFIHISLNVSQTDDYELPIHEIGKFRSYYTDIITTLDPEYNEPINPWLKPATFEDPFSENTIDQHNGKNEIIATNHINQEPTETFGRTLYLNISKILFTIYFAGILFFCVRLLFLIFWLGQIIKRNKVLNYTNYKIVCINKEIPPFSFFNYVFINKDVISEKDFEQILAHEKIHVSQKHSLDLFIAHVITVLQWFNPLVWLLQKAIKTNHEYIADSKVVDQGFEIIDYQSLLLSQLISIRSVELVNNFNLISIKKRLKMMTKIKSGFKAKMKAFLVIPTTIALFFLFADMTLIGPEKVLSNIVPTENNEVKSQLEGIWVNTAESFGKYIQFSNDKLSVLDGDINYHEFNLEIKGNQFILNAETFVKFKMEGNLLKIWWKENEFSVYDKSIAKNSMKAYLLQKKQKMELPEIVHYRTLDKTEYIIEVFLNNENITIQNSSGTFDFAKEMLLKAKQNFTVLDLPYVTVKLYVDANTSMENVHKLKQIMREIDLLKIAYAGYLQKGDLPDLMEHLIGIPKKMPPIDVKETSIEEVKEKGFAYFEIDADKDAYAKEKVRKNLHSFLTSNDKYIMCLVYYNNSLYKDYVEFNDIVYQVIYKLRNELAEERYSLKYNDLAPIQQKEIRNVYKMILTEKNLDVDN
jgi:BlaR1 peptidase M56